jgi:branched-subunit amino acid transport protein
MSEFVVLAISGVGLWAMRASFITFGARRSLPVGVERALGQARYGALAALFVTAMLPYGSADAGSALVPALAAAAAAAVAFQTRSLPWTLLGGVGVFWVAGVAI